MRRLIIYILVCVVLCACSESNSEVDSTQQKVVFNVEVSAPDTRTQLVNENGKYKAIWKEGDFYIVAQIAEKESSFCTGTVEADTPSIKVVAEFEQILNAQGVQQAREFAAAKRGPIASIYVQGLDRYEQGLDAVEKAVVSYGSVQTGQLEANLSWIGLFIALAPMLGFMGTVVGMIGAFDAIQAAGDISPTLVAGGIKVALLTTLMGLIAAVILQIFYNYIIAKIDTLVNAMEDASITLMDILTVYKK